MTVIDDYLSKVSPIQKKELERIRRIVKEKVPDAEETISYGMPTLKYNKKSIIHFAAFKNHMSIFPTGDPLIEIEDKLTRFRTSKGTLRFTEEGPIPSSTIKEIVAIRLKNISKK